MKKYFSNLFCELNKNFGSESDNLFPSQDLPYNLYIITNNHAFKLNTKNAKLHLIYR